MAELKLISANSTSTLPAEPVIPLTDEAQDCLEAMAAITATSQAGCDLAETLFLSLSRRLQEARVVDAENHFLGCNHALAEGGFLTRTGPVILAVAPALDGEPGDLDEYTLFDGLQHTLGKCNMEAALELALSELLQTMSSVPDDLDS